MPDFWKYSNKTTAMKQLGKNQNSCLSSNSMGHPKAKGMLRVKSHLFYTLNPPGPGREQMPICPVHHFSLWIRFFNTILPFNPDKTKGLGQVNFTEINSSRDPHEINWYGLTRPQVNQTCLQKFGSCFGLMMVCLLQWYLLWITISIIASRSKAETLLCQQRSV